MILKGQKEERFDSGSRIWFLSPEACFLIYYQDKFKRNN